MPTGMPPHFLRFVLRTLRRRGFAEADLLAGQELRAEQLDDEHFRLSEAMHARFVLNALELTGDAHLGVSLAEDYEVLDGGVATLAALGSSTVAEAIHLTARYARIHTRAIAAEPLDPDAPARLVFTTPLRDPRVAWFGVSSFVAILRQRFARLLDGASIIERAEFALPAPDDLAGLRARVPFAVAFEQPRCVLHFDAALLQRSTRRADPGSVRMFREASERELARIEAEEARSLASRVRALLRDQLAEPPSLDEAARALALSPRSLRRKLAGEGARFQQILDEVRQEVAEQLLRETTAPISRIAEALGFQSPSHFGRAFKRWTGRPPSSLRARS